MSNWNGALSKCVGKKMTETFVFLFILSSAVVKAAADDSDDDKLD